MMIVLVGRCVMEKPTEPFEEIEEYAPHLRRMWCYGRKAVLYEIRSISRETVDACLAASREILYALKPGEPYFSIYDFRFPEATLTPYLRAQFSELMTNFRNLPGATAIVLEPNFIARLSQLFISAQLRSQRQRRIFFSQETALGWIKKHL